METAIERKRRRNREWCHNNLERRRVYKREWRKNNREKINARQREKYQEHKEEKRAIRREWYRNNRELSIRQSTEWRKKNPERYREHQRKSYHKHKEARIRELQLWRIEHEEEYKQYCREYHQRKRREDPSYMISKNISRAMLTCLKKDKSGHSWEKLVGYTKDDLKRHLESLFDEKMNWDNYGSYWHIDHIIPKSWFSFKSKDEEGFKKCWALDNLQPLEGSKNMSKQDRYKG